MKQLETPFADLILLETKCFTDERGYFLESYQQERYKELNIPAFVQDNRSRSAANVLRGMHYQLPKAQGKLVFVTRGSVFDVVIDLRQSSSTFGQWFGVTLSESNHLQMYIPPGFAHGFCVTDDHGADFYYKCSDYYAPGCEQGVAWDDAKIGIKWPIKNPILSPKDKEYPNLNEISHDNLFS